MYIDGVPASVHAGRYEGPDLYGRRQNNTVTIRLERNDLGHIKAMGIPTQLQEVMEQPVSPQRYLPIPGVALAEGSAIVAGFAQQGSSIAREW